MDATDIALLNSHAGAQINGQHLSAVADDVNDAVINDRAGLNVGQVGYRIRAGRGADGFIPKAWPRFQPARLEFPG